MAAEHRPNARVQARFDGTISFGDSPYSYKLFEE